MSLVRLMRTYQLNLQSFFLSYYLDQHLDDRKTEKKTCGLKALLIEKVLGL